MLCVALSEDAACCLDFSRRFLKEQLQSNLPDEVSHARVRVPVFFNAAQPQPILDAVTVPGLHVVTVPAAAGMVSAMALPNLEKNSPVCGFRPGTSEVSLHDPLLIGVFEKARLANAVWDAIALTFRGDTLRAKVYEAVDNTRQKQQEKNRERNLRWGNPRQWTEPLYIASSAATGACTRLEDALQLTTVCGFVGPPGVSRLTPLPHARVGCAAEKSPRGANVAATVARTSCSWPSARIHPVVAACWTCSARPRVEAAFCGRDRYLLCAPRGEARRHGNAWK